MDPSIAALISAMAQAAEQNRLDAAQARRDHESTLAQMVQGQNSFMERLGVTMAQQVGPPRPGALRTVWWILTELGSPRL